LKTLDQLAMLYVVGRLADEFVCVRDITEGEYGADRQLAPEKIVISLAIKPKGLLT
jgi:hypothetical protein